MSKILKPDDVRRLLNGNVGVNWCLNKDFINAKNMGGLLGGGSSSLRMAIKSMLVESNHRATDLLLHSQKWVEAAIQEKEVSGGFPAAFLECEQRVVLSLCKWLQGKPEDIDLIVAAANLAAQYFKDTSDHLSDPFALGLEGLVFVDGKHYAEYLHLAKSNGRVLLGAPASKIRGEASVCAAICLAKTDGKYSDEEIATIIKRLLDINMNEWLTSGHELRAARWLKYAYWQGGRSGLTPRDVILKAYDHLPKECRPASQL